VTHWIVELRSVTDIDRLRTQGLPRRARFRIAFELEPTRRASWERRLDKYSRACGCEAGAIALFATAFGQAAFVSVNYQTVVARPLLHGSLALLALGVAMALGKALGLGFARLRLRSVLASLRREIS
jgi:hypothetical protein